MQKLYGVLSKRVIAAREAGVMSGGTEVIEV